MKSLALVLVFALILVTVAFLYEREVSADLKNKIQRHIMSEKTSLDLWRGGQDYVSKNCIEKSRFETELNKLKFEHAGLKADYAKICVELGNIYLERSVSLGETTEVEARELTEEIFGSPCSPPKLKEERLVQSFMSRPQQRYVPPPPHRCPPSQTPWSLGVPRSYRY